ncbi:MAG: IS200/IS605 family transposase [Lentisphaeria bacterium]|nr:IS200/IS605 family transposase [Lentisphaeria bacterium]
MPQSLSQVILHIVFSTKDRRRYLDDAIRDRTHAFLATLSRDRGCEALRVGGTDDHVHLICRLSRTFTISKLVEDVKRESSKWIKPLGADYTNFHWQRGYGAFSLSQSHLDQAIAYVSNQEEHHRKMSFQDEFRELLRRSGVEFDEKYVWD